MIDNNAEPSKIPIPYTINRTLPSDRTDKMRFVRAQSINDTGLVSQTQDLPEAAWANPSGRRPTHELPGASPRAEQTMQTGG